MRKRFRLKKRVSKRIFSKTASRTRRRNVSPRPMRGGYRM